MNNSPRIKENVMLAVVCVVLLFAIFSTGCSVTIYDSDDAAFEYPEK